MTGSRLPRGALSWALYDFANTIFSMNVLTMYLAQWVIVDRGVESFWYSLANSLSMVVVAVTLPVLGTLADGAPGGRVRWLLGFTVAAVGGTALIGVAAAGPPDTGTVVAALAAFALANTAFQGSLVFYNALLPRVSTPATIGWISGFGVALGYAGSIAGLLLVKPFVDAGGRAAAFLPTALLYALFALPLFLRFPPWGRAGTAGAPAEGLVTDTGASTGTRVADPARSSAGRGADSGIAPPPPFPARLRAAAAEVLEALRDTKRHPGVRRFLVANWLFVDAISTVILFMAVYAQEVMGMPDSVKIPFFILSTSGAIVGSLAAGRAADRLGPKRVLGWILVGWSVTLALVALTAAPVIFWGAGVVIGICLGGTWTTSRALLARLTPEAAHGRFFGLYALSDKAAAVLGPLLWGVIVWVAAPMGPARYRLAVLVLVGFILAGWWMLRGVPEAPRTGDRPAAGSA
jgi:UMF1 family MFS transporter